MDKVIKAKWVTALRDGSHQQTTGKLRNVDGDAFCCLGVLADVAGNGHWELDAYCVMRDSTDGPYEDSLEGELGWYAQHFGLTEAQETQLVRMNDGAKAYAPVPGGEDGSFPEVRMHTFAEIADWIEANL
jgi:hypothetical protein